MADLRSSRDDEGEERGGWAHEDKARGEQGRAREWEEAERQSREVKLGLHPLQVRFRIVTVSKYFGQETAFAELHRVNRVLALSTSIRPPLHPRCKQTRYVVWYTRRQRQPPGQRSATSYEDSIRRIADFSTVEGFWGCYCRMVRPSALPAPTDVHVFKDGIRPLWEDAHNRRGGKWMVRLRKPLTARMWEQLLMAVVGEQLEGAEEVCGVVLSVRFGEDILSIWNRSAPHSLARDRLCESIRKHLNLPPSYTMEYKPHDASLKDHSSYRNTWKLDGGEIQHSDGGACRPGTLKEVELSADGKKWAKLTRDGSKAVWVIAGAEAKEVVGAKKAMSVRLTAGHTLEKITLANAIPADWKPATVYASKANFKKMMAESK
ncbi:unnamed protein product [Closterium sp. NIES-65]|nr:unnamed protein product [Closterium sp. NIES-65]